MRLILIGMPGSGKSSVGRLLAEKLKYEFIDTDFLIEKKNKLTIFEIFAEFGEQYFRASESGLLNKLKLVDQAVIATGGGLPCSDNNIKILNHSGFTIYLKVSPKILKERLLIDADKRPLFQKIKTKNLENFLMTLLKEREIYYKQAQMIIDAEQNVERILNRIISNL